MWKQGLYCLDGNMTCCMESPGNWSVDMQEWSNDYKSLGGGCVPAVLRNGMELMGFVHPTLKKTVISQEAAEFLGIRSTVGPGGVSFGPIQIYLRATLNGRAQSFRVTPEHPWGGPHLWERPAVDSQVDTGDRAVFSDVSGKSAIGRGA